MQLRRHVSRALYDGHVATARLLERMETLLGRHDPSHKPDVADPNVTRFLKDVVFTIETEIADHFAFEEESVFPALAEAGEREMVALLLDEHREILPIAQRLAANAKVARGAGFTADTWREFHTAGAELAERLASHIRKEDFGLLPALDDLLDESADARLGLEMAARR